MDIYKKKERRDAGQDETTAAEDAIIVGREMKVGKKKKDLMLEEKDTESLEPAKGGYREN